MSAGSPKLRVTIDKLRLDDEWSDQAEQVYEWAMRAAEAAKAYEEAKADLALTAAELDKNIRDDPASFGIGKLSNEVVSQTIVADRIYQATEKRVNEARHNLKMCDAAVLSLEHKKRALTKLTDLWIHDYYSDSSRFGLSDDEKQALRTRGRRRISEIEQNKEDRDEDGDDGD